MSATPLTDALAQKAEGFALGHGVAPDGNRDARVGLADAVDEMEDGLEAESLVEQDGIDGVLAQQLSDKK